MFGHLPIPRPALAAGSTGATASARLLRVLVVSDRDLWFQSLDSVLGPGGHEVLAASSGKSAIEMLSRVRPDALIVHDSLRDMSALALCGSLRATGTIGGATPVILITSGPCTREERLNALRAGAWDCYGFPVDPETLLLKVRIYANARMEAEQAREEARFAGDAGA